MTHQTLADSHYLPFDAFALIGRHAWLSLLCGLVSLGAAYALLRHRFERDGTDILTVAVFLAAVALFSAACFYLLATQSGYRVFHPGF